MADSDHRIDRELAERGCALVVGTVGPDGAPYASRGWGLSLTPTTTGPVRLLLNAGDETTLANLRRSDASGGRIAVTGADVVTLCPIIDWSQVPTDERIGLHQQDKRFSGLLPCPVPCSQGTYVLRVKGASMEPKFANGDLIFVDPEVAADSGKYVVVHLAGSDEADFKQLIIEGGRQYLKALSPDWPDRITEMDEATRVCGVVVFKGEMV